VIERKEVERLRDEIDAQATRCALKYEKVRADKTIYGRGLAERCETMRIAYADAANLITLLLAGHPEESN
jgi:hypothetical protein